jgi:hypothetical protein
VALWTTWHSNYSRSAIIEAKRSQESVQRWSLDLRATNLWWVLHLHIFSWPAHDYSGRKWRTLWASSWQRFLYSHPSSGKSETGFCVWRQQHQDKQLTQTSYFTVKNFRFRCLQWTISKLATCINSKTRARMETYTCTSAFQQLQSTWSRRSLGWRQKSKSTSWNNDSGLPTKVVASVTSGNDKVGRKVANDNKLTVWLPIC